MSIRQDSLPGAENRAVLVVEDESSIAESLKFALERDGFRCLHASSARDALAALRNEPARMLILDVGLPDRSGFDLMRDIRKEWDLPVLFLTARADEVDRVVGFELGADDYVTKPFSVREVVARVRAILKRSEKDERPAAFEVDHNKLQIRYFGEVLKLSRYEYRLLYLFVERPGWIFTREKIMELLWEDPAESYDRTVDTHVKTLRAKLRAVRPDLEAIETHRGMGYSLKEKLE